jgi:hypothetical protein
MVRYLLVYSIACICVDIIHRSSVVFSAGVVKKYVECKCSNKLNHILDDEIPFER